MKKSTIAQAGKEIYRHYGSKLFDINKFIPVSNRFLSNKPFGGLWACPTKDVDIGWKEWCLNEDFKTDNLDNYFDFTIKDNSKILVIKDIKDLDKLPRLKTDDEYSFIVDRMTSDIDFEFLSKNYDGMMVWIYRAEDIPKDNRYFDGIYYKMYGWDVDTLLVFNPDIIEEV